MTFVRTCGHSATRSEKAPLRPQAAPEHRLPNMNFTYTVPGKFSSYYMQRPQILRTFKSQKKQYTSKEASKLHSELKQLRTARKQLGTTTEGQPQASSNRRKLLEEQRRIARTMNSAAVLIQSHVRKMIMRGQHAGELALLEKQQLHRNFFELSQRISLCKEIRNH